MRTFALTTMCLLLSAVHARPQHQQQIDPAYLQQYYAQVAQAAGARAGAEATPIFEQDSSADQQQQQYLAPQAHQIRIKDSVADQVRAQQQQQYIAPSVRQYLQQPQQKPQPQPQQQPQHVQYLSQPQQQIHYRPAPPPPKQTLAIAPQQPRRPAPPQQHYQHQQPQHQQQHHQQPKELNKEEEETYEQNPSYQFGFDVKDDEFTNYQNRKETRDGNVIKGSYSVVDSDGFIRTVTYTADPKEGFKAEVVREPTDIVVKVPTQAPPTAQQPSSLRHHQQQPQAAPQPQYYQHQQPQPTQYRSAPKQHQQHQQHQQQHQQQPQQPQYQYE